MGQDYGVHASTGYWIDRLQRAMTGHLSRELAQYEATGITWAILSAISNGTACSPGELSRFIGADASYMTRQLDRLEKKGLVARHRDVADRRAVRLALTESGRGLVPKLARCSQRTNEKFLRGLSEQDLEQFNRTLKHMLRNADAPLEVRPREELASR